MNEVKIGKFGRILDGDPKGWYVFVQDDKENTGGFLVLLSASSEPADFRGFDDWVENAESLQSYFLSKKRQIHWLN